MSFLPTSPLPAIIAQWAALIPLATHLASRQHSHQLLGELALTGNLSISLFPKLGVLREISNLLSDSFEFFDRASSKGSETSVVRDVDWGSIFPCANGAARSMVTKYALKRAGRPIIIPDKPQYSAKESAANAVTRSGEQSSAEKSPNHYRSSAPIPTASTQSPEGSVSGQSSTQALKNQITNPSPFRRYQTLHIIQLHRKVIKPSLGYRMRQVANRSSVRLSALIFLVAGSIVLFLFGSYGTAVIVLCATISQGISESLKIRRPPGYLGNIEAPLNGGCMLSSAHDNCSNWYLYVGDRGVVDYLLNKPMVIIPSCPPLFLYWYRFAHYVHLLAMTYVAAQQGWDGVCLVVAMAVAYILRLPLGDEQMVRRWFDAEGIEVKARKFQFTGRTALVLAVLKFSKTRVTSWMDALVYPSPRREALLKRQNGEVDEIPGLTNADEQWVALHSGLASDATAAMLEEFPTGKQ